ncbi:unnamed protein product, partial [Oikopleura dioica]
KELPTFKEQEDEYKKAAGLWLRSEECQSQEQDEHIKIHVETTCLPIPTETPKMEIRSSPVKVPTPENKPSRAERRIDPELQKLKCGQGGAYRWSMSKQSFNKVVCPFCIRSEDPSKSGINFIRADYWRRHITEVHKKENEIEHSKNLVICLKCYHIGIDKAKDAKESGSGLPDFSSLFFTADQKEEHREKMHKGENITFVSAWEKKEASQSRRKRTSHHSTDKNSHSCGKIFSLSAKKSPSPGSKACSSSNRHLCNNATALPLSLLTQPKTTTVSSCFFLQSITFADANVASCCWPSATWCCPATPTSQAELCASANSLETGSKTGAIGSEPPDTSASINEQSNAPPPTITSSSKSSATATKQSFTRLKYGYR